MIKLRIKPFIALLALLKSKVDTLYSLFKIVPYMGYKSVRQVGQVLMIFLFLDISRRVKSDRPAKLKSKVQKEKPYSG